MLNRPEALDPITLDETYAQYVNPQWVKLLTALGINRHFVRASGVELFTAEGERYLDFLAGYGVYNVGHHHPAITEALIDELRSQRPSMLQSHVPSLAAELAEKLCDLAKGRIEKVHFANTGSEGIESAMKFSRKFTGRDGILYAKGGFHGLTYGALSLMSNPWWREGFGSLVPNTTPIPFGDLEAAKRELEKRTYAAFILEPIQGESGVVIPQNGYLKDIQAICDRVGTLLVIDEVQTGVYRTGPFLASHHFDIQPDIIVMAKALSGGQVPVGAVLMRSDICKSTYSSADKAFVHASTFGENALAMRAALATLKTCEDERVSERSRDMGFKLRAELSQRLKRFSFVKEVRGVGLFNAIEFQAPSTFGLSLLFSSFRKAHPGLFGQMFIKTIFDKGKILCQMAGNNYMAIKSLPPLIISDEQLAHYVQSVEDVCHLIQHEKAEFWPQGLKIGARALG